VHVAGPDTLVVFCRRPRAGVGKRRIAAELGDLATAELAEHLLAAALEDARAWPGEVVVAPASGDDLEWAAGLPLDAHRVVPQPEGENLGARILHVDRAVRAAGAGRVVTIGSDAPLLAAADYAAARRALEQSDVVLGPASDGGVTLMGARRPWPQTLAGLPWSSGELGAALERACRDAGLSVARLGERPDVDRASDLPGLQAGLAGDERPARRRLRAWLEARPRHARVSIVVPVLGDAPELRRLLDLLGSPPGPGVETIVVDGRADPACRALCQERSAVYLASAPGRGAQLRAGAARATGAILWFLHADAEPPKDAPGALRAAVAGGADGGYLRFRFAGPSSPARRLLEACVAMRNRFGGIPYGDQGLFFTREAYDRAGGFAEAPLFEEVPLVRSVRRHGRFVGLACPIGVSPRRWERDGWLRRTVENRLLALGYAIGLSPARLARWYRTR